MNNIHTFDSLHTPHRVAEHLSNGIQIHSHTHTHTHTHKHTEIKSERERVREGKRETVREERGFGV